MYQMIYCLTLIALELISILFFVSVLFFAVSVYELTMGEVLWTKGSYLWKYLCHLVATSAEDAKDLTISILQII